MAHVTPASLHIRAAARLGSAVRVARTGRAASLVALQPASGPVVALMDAYGDAQSAAVPPDAAIVSRRQRRDVIRACSADAAKHAFVLRAGWLVYAKGLLLQEPLLSFGAEPATWIGFVAFSGLLGLLAAASP